MDKVDNKYTMTILECIRAHTGKYIITAKNKAGQKTAHVRVNVLGKHA